MLIATWPHVQVDSVLAQVYTAGGALGWHTDLDLGWGLAVSLGATAEFSIMMEDPRFIKAQVAKGATGLDGAGGPGGGGQEGKASAMLVVESGDVIIGDFGQMLHAVRVRGAETAPAWWREPAATARHHGRARMNVLFRQALSRERQQELARRRARVLYPDLDYEELGEHLGYDNEGDLATYLRHAHSA